MDTTIEKKDPRHTETVTAESIVVRFSGDSGDGMQLTGMQFTDTAALLGKDISTFPEYPAEIRAPAGTLAGDLIVRRRGSTDHPNAGHR